MGPVMPSLRSLLVNYERVRAINVLREQVVNVERWW